MRSTFRSTVAAAGLCLASAVFAADQEQPGVTVDVSQLPTSVQTTLQREGARISKVEQETQSGKAFYEATLSKAGKNYSLRLDGDGQIIKREDLADAQQKPK